MHQSINKKKIYFYLLILFLFSSTFNFNIIAKFQKLHLISDINIVGISEKEKNVLQKNLEILKNKNIFLIKKQETINILNKNSFLDSYNIEKVFPSKILVNVKKTEFVGITILDGVKFYIGKNGKLTEVSLVEREYNLPQVFGKFNVTKFLNLQEILNSNGFNLNEIKKYYYYKSNRWDIESNDDLILMLPSENLEIALKNYHTLLKTNKIIENNLIDLRLKNKIILSNEKK